MVKRTNPKERGFSGIFSNSSGRRLLS